MSSPNARERRTWPGRLRLVLVVAGVALVGYLIAEVGPHAIGSAFASLSWRLLLVVVFPTGLAVVVDTLGWHFTFAQPPRSFARLLGIRLAGEAVNMATPTASLGGDVVKAYLLRPEVPLRDGVASVIADKTTNVVALVLLLLVGLVVGALALPLPGPLLLAVAGALVVEIGSVAGFVAVQLRGLAGSSGRLLARLHMAPREAHQAALAGMDRALRSLYLEHRGRVLASVFCHLGALALGTLEIYMVMMFIEAPISPAAAFAIGAFGTAVKFFTFMVPASIGALEGGNVAIFAALGLPGAAGLTYTLVRRLREIVWIAAGFAVSAVISPRPA